MLTDLLVCVYPRRPRYERLLTNTVLLISYSVCRNRYCVDNIGIYVMRKCLTLVSNEVFNIL